MSDIGPIEPGRWHCWQFFWKIGAMSRAKVTSGASPAGWAAADTPQVTQRTATARPQATTRLPDGAWKGMISIMTPLRSTLVPIRTFYYRIPVAEITPQGLGTYKAHSGRGDPGDDNRLSVMSTTSLDSDNVAHPSFSRSAS